jgi:acetylornithine deacetylase/succinyl-diaminopimelate desuccinylase-like protein
MATAPAPDVASLVDADELIELTKGICRIPSPLGEEGPVAEYTADWMERQGWEVDLQEVVVGRPNVVAISRGSPDYKSFLLNGHLDMPMPFGQWRHDPFDPWVEDDVL